MDRVSISIIIVHWNVPDLLAACLRSIACQASCAETIVVDNASPLGAPADVVSRHEPAKLISLEENLGFAAANNLGAREASGDVLLFLNPDTELLPGALSKMIETLHLNPRIGLVAPLLLNPDRSVQSSGYRFPGVMNVICDLFPIPDRLAGSSLNGRLSPGNGQLPYVIDYPLGAAMMVRRTAFEEAGGFDDSYFMYSEEVDLCQCLASAGWKRLLAPAARVVHHGGQSTSQQSAEMFEALWLSRARYHDRWTSGWRRQAISRLVDASIGRRSEASEQSRERIKAAFRSPR